MSRREAVVAGDILKTLDDNMFPCLDGMYEYFARGLLRARRSDNSWLITFELFCFSVQEADFVNVVFAYGNRIKECGLQPPCRGLSRVRVSRKWPFLDADTGRCIVDPRRFKVVLNGKVRSFLPDRGTLGAAGVTDARRHPAGRIARVLAYLLGDKLFRKDDSFYRLVQLKAPAIHIYASSAWRHPDVAIEQRPSDIEFFRQLAEALAMGKPEIVGPVRDANSGWQDWSAIDAVHGGWSRPPGYKFRSRE